MIRGVRCFLVLLVAGLLPATASGAAGDDILGEWYNAEKDARIEIFACGTRYCGRIVWLKEPDYPDGSRDGVPGTPKLDHNNPDPSRTKEPVIGLRIVRDFEYAGENRWHAGTVYDPKNGKTYKGKMTLTAPDRLDLRGYVGIPLFGRTTTWTR
jgi:uncharacterized protein (DUF2147 family)